MAEAAGWAQTVAGHVPAAALGVTYCHEHLLTDPAPWLTGEDRDLTLDDEAKVVAELADFRAAGGESIVELTTPEFGRDPRGLARIAAISGVRIIATTGHVSEEYWRGVLDLESAAEPDLVEAYVHDLTEGIDGTDIRAGVIKAGTSRDEVTPTEHKLLRAAARAQVRTGAPITTHTTAGTAALDQVEILDRAGADLSHVCIGHLDRRLDWPTHRRVAATGAFLGYDCISKEQYESDADRAAFIARLVDAGLGDRVCLSGDLARRRYLRSWGGGPGYRYLLGPFAERLAGVGLDDAARRMLLVDNPARLLAWHSPAVSP